MSKKKCPFCGGNVKVELKAIGDHRKPCKETKYIAKCNQCEARAIDADTQEDALNYFFSGRFTKETIMLSKLLGKDSVDEEGMVRLLERHMGLLGDEYKKNLTRLAEIKAEGEETGIYEKGATALATEIQMLEEGMSRDLAKRIQRMVAEEMKADGDVFVHIIKREKTKTVAEIHFLKSCWTPFVVGGRIGIGVSKRSGKFKIYHSSADKHGRAIRLLGDGDDRYISTTAVDITAWATDNQGRHSIKKDGLKGGFYIE